MNQGKYVFAQLFDILPKYEFDKCVVRYQGNFKIKGFTCWLQFLSMSFGQLTNRESLRDAVSCLAAHQKKFYHLGINFVVSRSTLAEANENRNWRIFADFAQVLLLRARRLYLHDDFGLDLENAVYALDATTIDLCLSVFWWAKFRKAKAAVKLHTLLDLRKFANLYSYYRRQNARCQHLGRTRFRAAGNLSDGQGLSGFRAAFSDKFGISIFCHAGESQFGVQTDLLDKS